jgi:hypothetical protein
MASPSVEAAHAQVSARDQAERGTGVGCAVASSTVDGAFNASSISSRASAAESRRRLRSFSRQRRSRRRIDGGVSAGSSAQSGSRINRNASVSDTSSPSNARLPVNISYKTTPKAHTSLRLSTGWPFACSGLM